MDRLAPSQSSEFPMKVFRGVSCCEKFVPEFAVYFDVAFEEDSYLYLGQEHILWSDGNHMSISEAQEELLCNLFKYAVESARTEIEWYDIGYDGVSTTISYQGKLASCWCPEDGNCKMLVDLICKIQCAISHHDVDEFKKIIPDVLELTYKFRQQCWFVT